MLEQNLLFAGEMKFTPAWLWHYVNGAIQYVPHHNHISLLREQGTIKLHNKGLKYTTGLLPHNVNRLPNWYQYKEVVTGAKYNVKGALSDRDQ